MIPIKNKGMYLETLINITNEKYLNENICVVTKIPTNVKLMNTDANFITKAAFQTSFNCDYIGVYKGIYLEFEAKETSKNYFDFNLIRKNQSEKLLKVNHNGGISFLIIHFSEYESYFLVEFLKILEWIKENKKRIPYEWFLEYGYEIYLTNDLKLDYVSVISRIIDF